VIDDIPSTSFAPPFFWATHRGVCGGGGGGDGGGGGGGSCSLCTIVQFRTLFKDTNNKSR